MRGGKRGNVCPVVHMILHGLQRPVRYLLEDKEPHVPRLHPMAAGSPGIHASLPSWLRILYVDMERRPHREADEETKRGHAQADDSHLSETLAERLVLGDRDIVAEQQDHTHCQRERDP